MPESPQFLVERLTSEGEKMSAFFESLSPEQWQQTVYTEGAEWTIRSVLAHFVMAERGFLKLFDNILGGGPGVSEDFSIDRYNARQQEKTRDMTPAELLQAYRDVRAEIIAWVSQRSQADLQLQGRHAAMGFTTLLEMVKMIYLHNQMHLRDIKKRFNESANQ
ncbi:MAG: DinB family protein [Chloroflexota bacterium]